MRVYVLTFTDYEHKSSMLIGAFSSMVNALESMQKDGESNVDEEIFGKSVEIDMKNGFASAVYTSSGATDARFAYNINRMELNELLDEHDQIEI